MYKQVETQHIAKLSSGCSFRPLATLKDEHGGVAHIATDDGCYVLTLERDGVCDFTPWIFSEAFEVLKTLPSL